MDDLTTSGNAVAFRSIRHVAEDLAAHLFDQSAESLLHVANLVVLVIRPLPVETQNRDSVFVLHHRIELTVALVVGHHLPAPGKVHVRSRVPAVVVLQRFAVAAAGWIALDAAEESVAGRTGEATPNFDVVAAREVELPVVDPPRHVDVISADAVLVVRDVVHHLRDESTDIGAGRVGEILSD